MEKIKEIFFKYKEIISYLIFGVLTTLVSLTVYYGLVFTVLYPNISLQLQVANILSWVAGVLFAYFTNRVIVFNSKNKNYIKEFISFTGSRVITLVLDTLLMILFVKTLNINDMIAKVIVQIVVIIGNYLISKLFVFKK